jgi:hypothetical protein
MPEPIALELGTYNMPLQPISTAYFTNPSHQYTSITAFEIARQNLNIA